MQKTEGKKDPPRLQPSGNSTLPPGEQVVRDEKVLLVRRLGSLTVLIPSLSYSKQAATSTGLQETSHSRSAGHFGSDRRNHVIGKKPAEILVVRQRGNLLDD